MASESMIDHSPQVPSAVPSLQNASNLVLIDNYDSFTWNIFQYLCLEGATVSVYRNDEISLKELIEKNPSQLVLSPGPGHPDTDTGITCSVIRHFSGKIPILGVCMGEQCIYSVFGGKVDVTGEILHGKTSPLRHDQKGVYAGLPQDLPVTRYHSLAGTHATLPECLEISSWTSRSQDIGKGVIMGVRHKTLLVEGIQFHPESILTAEGRMMFRNFLQMRGGTWAENENSCGGALGVPQTPPTTLPTSSSPANGTIGEESILEKIYRKRRESVKIQKQVPSLRPSDLQECYDMDLSPPSISFPDRLRSSPYGLSLMAEIKRASPSKGPIGMNISAPAQARKYTMAGASVISVLTEPDWFKGSIEDLRSVRQSLEGIPGRPAVLRKEFIFDEYQILEARLAGADTVLLIVKMLDAQTLERLYKYCQKLGMEPLVEVNTTDEMKTAVKLGAQVIGVNNRNLATFEVDLQTTSRLMDGVPPSTIVCALSGISSPNDVKTYKRCGVGAVLVGEALMRTPDVGKFVSELLAESSIATVTTQQDLLVKICGTRTPAAARVAIEAGADLIGIILVPGRKRSISDDVAKLISTVVHTTPKSSGTSLLTASQPAMAKGYFAHTSGYFSRPDRALLVGVFQNQSLSFIRSHQQLFNLDVVQLHGSEPIEWASLIPVPVIRRFGPQDSGLASQGYHALPLLDSAIGGTGSMGDLAAMRKSLHDHNMLRVMLAGGLNSGNIGQVLEDLAEQRESVIGVDVSSGVEINGAQDLEAIRSFVHAAKKISRSR